MRRYGPPLVLMALIFFFSAQPDLNSGLGDWDTLGRKLIHAATYGALWFLWWRALGRTWPAVAITLLYAVSGVLIAIGLSRRGTPAARRPRAGGHPPAEARRP